MNISFVIPAYNAEKTIKRAIDSILSQKETKLNYEIIVVNDGSKDKTKEIMKEYENIDTIKYYEKENAGVSDTRNYGVKKAIGEYIIFVDSDDYISNTLLKDIETYINKKVELIKWNPIFVDESGNEITRTESVLFDEVKGKDGFNKLFGKDKLIDCLWNYAIKKENILEFPAGTYHEDYATMPLIILKSKTMVSTNKYEYYYVQSKNSIMRNNDEKKSRKKLQDKLKHFDTLIKEENNMKLDKLTKENFEIFVANSLLIAIKDIKGENLKWFKNELKLRKISKYIKIRNIKQLLKKIYINCLIIK